MDKGVYAALLRNGRLALKVSLFSTPISLLEGKVTWVALVVALVTFVVGVGFLYLANKYSPYKYEKKSRSRKPSKSNDKGDDSTDGSGEGE